MIRLVIFDWAGTTVDFGSCAPAGAFVEAFARMGVPVSIAEARAPMGLHKKEHLRVMLREPALDKRWQELRGKPWNEADIDELYRLVTPLQIEAAARHADLTPGLLETVAALRNGRIKIGATTGYFREAAKACAQAAAKQGYVPDCSICADDVPVGRPAPWMIFRVMEALNVYPPSAVVKVGDTVVDIEDGLNAGVWSIGVIDSSNVMGLSANEFAALSETERDDRRAQVREVFRKAGAHGTVNTLSELPGIIVEQLTAGLPAVFRR
jgi:phosphonoacetaldehyde hydrolase